MVRLATLFSGMGGVEAGAIASRLVTPVGGIELDPNKPVLSKEFSKIHEENYNHPLHLLTVQRAAELDFNMFRNIDWLHSSPVCSNLSMANRNRGEKEVDISNVQATCKAIATLQPRNVTIEQVPLFRESEGAKILYQYLTDNDYLYQWKVLDMADFSVPNNRLRFFLLAWKRGAKQWRFPARSRQVGWYEACKDIPFADLSEEKLSKGTLVAVRSHLYQYASDTFLVEKKTQGQKPPTIRDGHQPAPTVIRGIFTDNKKGQEASLVSRFRFFDALIEGQIKTLNLRHIARITSFPDWVDFPDVPAISGVGMGYAVPPRFIKKLALSNLGGC